MQRLAGAHEHLDGPLDDARALAGNLRDLRRINTVLGGTTLSLNALLALAGDEQAPLRVLDVGTGGADIPAAIRRRWPSGNPAPTFVAVDSRPEVIAAARALDPTMDAGIQLTVADGRSLPWPDGAFDVGHASLVLHHLDPAEAVAFLRELARVARRGVIVNDLNRARVHWLGAWLLGHLLTRNPLTRHDAPLSVRRAYTPREMAHLLRDAGLQPLAIQRGFFGHRYAISAVPVHPQPGAHGHA